MYLAENLKFLREQNGKTQGELAVLFGIEQKTISSWECGSRKPPIGTIVSLAKLYRVSLDDLVLTDMRPPIPVYALNLAYLRKKHGMTQQEICFKLRLLPYAAYNFPILFSNLPVVPIDQHFLLSCSTSHSGSFFKWCHKMKPACFEFVSIKSKAVSEDVSHNCNFLFWCVSIH